MCAFSVLRKNYDPQAAKKIKKAPRGGIGDIYELYKRQLYAEE